MTISWLYAPTSAADKTLRYNNKPTASILWRVSLLSPSPQEKITAKPLKITERKNLKITMT